MRRPGIIVSEQTETEPIHPPKTYINRISVQIDVFSPPNVPTQDILATLDRAYDKAVKQVLREM